MPFHVDNNRSQLPVTQEWRVETKPTRPGTTSRPAAPASPANVSGQVGGSAAHGAQSLKGRATSATPARPRDPIGNAVLQNAHQLNSVMNGIESLRPGADQELPPLGKAMLQQIDRVAEACDLITGGPAVGESLIDQWNALADLVGRNGAPGSLAQGLEALHDQSGVSDVKVGKELNQIQSWTDQVVALAEDRMKYISQSLGSSALSVAKHYETKANMNSAAVAVLEDAIVMAKSRRNDKAVAVLEKGKASFEAREARLKQAADEHRHEIGQPKDFGGKKKPGPFQKLLHPVDAFNEWRTRSKCVEQIVSGKGEIDVEARHTNEMSIVEDALAQILKNANVGGVDVKHEVEHAFLNALDANPAWKEPLKNEIHLPVVSGPSDPAEGPAPLPAHTLIVKSEITPAAAANMPGYDGQGVNAHRSAEHIHSTNLAHTTLQDSDGQTMFSGVRHGVLSAYSITKEGVKDMPDSQLKRLMIDLLPGNKWKLDKDGNWDVARTMRDVRSKSSLTDLMRAAANKNRATEVVAMTVASDPAIREAALKGETPTVSILSLSLLTPDSFRKGVHDNESQMVLDQVQAWGAVEGKQTVQIPGEDGNPVYVRVNVQPVPMNYGVNKGAVKGVAGVHTEEVSGWHVSDTLNDEALHSLFGGDLTNIADSRKGVLGERIAALESRHRVDLDAARTALQAHNSAVLRNGVADPEAVNTRRMALEAEVKRLENVPNDASTPLGAALELTRQISDIRREGAHRNAGTEPYKMPTRLAVLADLLGVKVAFNCKSGKDRTGELDAEVKHMKTEMAITGKVPHYKRERTPEETRRFHEVVTNAGNLRMQELNTGFAGYKLKGVSAIYKQFDGDGDDDLTRNFHGMSHMTAT